MFKHAILAGAVTLVTAATGVQADRSNSGRNPLADAPDRVKVEIADLHRESNDRDRAHPKTFKAGKKVRFALTVTNTSDGTVTVFRIDSFYQNRPRLVRGGQELPYREEVVKLLESKDKDPIGERAPTAITAGPGQTKPFGTLDLNVWYGPLEPGVYQLTNRHRLVYGGRWTADSAAITFEVGVEQN